MTRLLECLNCAEHWLQQGLSSRRRATDPMGDNSKTKIKECRDLLDRIENEDGIWARRDGDGA